MIFWILLALVLLDLCVWEPRRWARAHEAQRARRQSVRPVPRDSWVVPDSWLDAAAQRALAEIAVEQSGRARREW